MKVNRYIFRKIVYFSGWSRRNYAVFSALGKEVRISNLNIHICENALLKSALKGVIVAMDAVNRFVVKVLEKNVLEWHIIFLSDKGEVCPVLTDTVEIIG